MNTIMTNSNYRRNFDFAYALYSKSLTSFLTRLLIVWVACIALTGEINAKDRYEPKNVSSAADGFLARAEQPVINVEFIVAHTVNTVYHAIREGRDPLEDGIVIDGSNSGSVVIGPGTDAGNLVIINENHGDSIVINRD